MTNAELRRFIILTSIPAIMQMFLKMMVGITNKVMVGQMGEAVIAGVGVSEQLIGFLLMIFAAVGAGITTISAQYIGAGKKSEVKYVFGSGMILGIAASIFITLLFFIFSESVLGIMGASGEIINEGRKYLEIVSFSIPSIILTFIMTSVFRAYADNKTPMYSSFAAMIIDIAFGFLFIIIMKMGISGAGYSALISRNTELIVMAVAFQKKRHITGISLADIFKLQFDKLKKIVKIGWPISIDMFIWQIGGIAVTYIILKLGTVAAGVNEILKIIPSLIVTPIMGIAATTTAIIGQDLGKGERAEAERKAGEVIKIGYIFVGLAALTVILFSGMIPQMFKFSEEGREIAALAIICSAVIQVLILPNFICTAIIRAGGDTEIIILITTIGTMIIVPLAYLFAVILGMGIYGVILGSAIGESTKAILFFRRYKKGKWQKKLI